MKFQKYLEAISKKEWKGSKGQEMPKYRKEVIQTFKDAGGAKQWFKMYKEMKQLMTRLNGGKFASVVVIDPQNISRKHVNVGHRNFILFLQKLEYSASEESIKLNTISTKSGTKMALTDFLKQWDKKVENVQKIDNDIDRLEKKDELTAKEKEILELKKKEFALIREYKNVRPEDKSDSIFKGKKIIFSIQPIKIASQSTKVSWNSCQNLDSGGHREYVGSGIANGVIVCFLVDYKDDDIAAPISRTLIKPFVNDDGDIYWYADTVYTATADKIDKDSFNGQDPKEIQSFASRTAGRFKAMIFDILAPHNDELPEGDYELPEGIYRDSKGSYSVNEVTKYAMKGDLSDIKTKSSKFLTDLLQYVPEVINHKGFQEALFSHNVIEGDLDLSGTDIVEFGKPWSTSTDVNLFPREYNEDEDDE